MRYLALACSYDEWIVAEHGGVLYDPARRTRRPLAEPLPDKLVEALQERGVEPLAIGEVSVATDQAVEAALGQAIEATGVDVAVVADKGMAVAVPVGVDKASGLAAALAELELSPHNVVGVRPCRQRPRVSGPPRMWCSGRQRPT
jgi:cobalamin biosynthesis protein CbiG